MFHIDKIFFQQSQSVIKSYVLFNSILCRSMNILISPKTDGLKILQNSRSGWIYFSDSSLSIIRCYENILLLIKLDYFLRFIWQEIKISFDIFLVNEHTYVLFVIGVSTNYFDFVKLIQQNISLSEKYVKIKHFGRIMSIIPKKISSLYFSKYIYLYISLKLVIISLITDLKLEWGPG